MNPKSDPIDAEPTPSGARVPQHSYSRELERGRNLFAIHFGGLSDDEWLTVLKRTRTEPVIDGVEFPGFPEAELQTRIHGGAGEEQIVEAVDFYRFCRDNTYRVPEPTGNRRMLDFGAGWGRMTRGFMRDFPPAGLYGFEPNLLLCSLARALNPYVAYFQGSTFPDNSLPRDWFDLVIGYSVFSHLPESYARAWLGEINRSLRPGGWCVLTTWGKRFMTRLSDDQAKRVRGEDLHWYTEWMLDRIGDIPARLDEYERGEFIFVGESDAGYGDAFIPVQALERILREEGLDFKLLRFDDTELPQDAFILRRPE